MQRLFPALVALLALPVVGNSLTGCSQGSSTAGESSAAASAQDPEQPNPPLTPSASASARTGMTDEEIAEILNPKHLEPYKGPTATVRGTVKIIGDPPPSTPVSAGPECTRAAAMYGQLFRRGPQGELADAMVAVTKYDGFVPASSPTRSVQVSGCAFETRTVVATFGQRIEVSNLDDKTSYMPYLDGAPFRAMLVAVPKGRPVQLYAYEPGHYLLRDVMPRPFEVADVFVLPYSTFDVTSEQGTFTIGGVPVGPARIDAFLPVVKKSVGKPIVLVEGVNEINLEIVYDAKTDVPVPIPSAIWGDRKR